MIETHKRTIIRTIVWRLLSIVVTSYWTGLGDAVVIHVILLIFHYVFERLCLKVRWGLK
jgi:hypothetical protein